MCIYTARISICIYKAHISVCIYMAPTSLHVRSAHTHYRACIFTHKSAIKGADQTACFLNMLGACPLILLPRAGSSVSTTRETGN